jgi:eukaryotic-like serine/threonine-protein kinase
MRLHITHFSSVVLFAAQASAQSQATEKSGKLAVVQASARGALEAKPAITAGVLDLLQACQAPHSAQVFLGEETEDLLVIPVATSNISSGGALLLGEKKSEEPYSATDRHLLEGIADSIAVVWENVWL